jgi:hypothetical protein
MWKRIQQLHPVLWLVLLLLSACNLSSDVPAGEITPARDENTSATPLSATEEASPSTPTSLSDILLTPNINASVRSATRPPSASGGTQAVPNISANVTPLPTSPTGESAAISSPTQGMTVAPGTIQISGVVNNLPEDRFTLSLVAPNGSSINTQDISLRNPNNVSEIPWSAAMQITRYTGPAQIRVVARTAEDREMTLAAVDIMIGQGSPSGGAVPTTGSVRSASSPTGTIDSPANGETATGDPIMVTGTAGGFPGGTFTLELLASNGTVLSSIPITLTGSDTAAVPWAAPITTGGYQGQATIRAVVTVNGSEVVLASANVTLG